MGIEYKHTNRDKTAPELLTKSQGKKFDAGKPGHDLLPFEALDEIAKVLSFGEKKYAAGNWANGIEMRRLLSAAYRHMGQFNSGQDFDEESGINHLAHAACNLLFALWMYKHKPEMDNRWIKEIRKTNSSSQS